MPTTWNPRQVLDIYPEDSGFTCVGTTRQARRCRNSFIRREYLKQASVILDTLPELQDFRNDQTYCLSKLNQLAYLTLCPRWHQTKIPQADQVAASWLGRILDLDRRGQGERYTVAPPPRSHTRAYPTPPPEDIRSGPPPPYEAVPSRAQTASTYVSAASRARDHWASQPLARNPPPSPSPPTSPQRTSHTTATQQPSARSSDDTRARRSNAPSEESQTSSHRVRTSAVQPSSHASTVTQASPQLIQINLNITIQRRHRHHSSNSSRHSSNIPSPSSGADSHSNPRSPRSVSSSTSSRSGSVSSDNTTIINANIASLNALLQTWVDSLVAPGTLSRSSTASTRSSRRSTAASIDAVHDSSSQAPSNGSDISVMPPLGPAADFVSPPYSPAPTPHRGSLSISTDSPPLSPSPQPQINTPSSSGFSTPVMLSPPISPLLLPASTPAGLSPPSSPASGSIIPPPIVRKPLPDICYVCYELIPTPEDAVWCRASCGQNVCLDCFEEWRFNQEAFGSAVKCGFCRAPWVS